MVASDIPDKSCYSLETGSGEVGRYKKSLRVTISETSASVILGKSTRMENRFPTLLVPQRWFEVELFLPLSATLKLCFAHKAPKQLQPLQPQEMRTQLVPQCWETPGRWFKTTNESFTEHKHLFFCLFKDRLKRLGLFWLLPPATFVTGTLSSIFNIS